MDDLFATYSMVANPAFTDSTDVLDHSVRLSEWRREFPESSTPLVALARAYIDWAWQARGAGLASSVTDEGWKLFHTRLAEAERLLRQAIELGAEDGEPFRLMIIVALGEGWPWEEVRAILDEGQKIDPTYYPMYTQAARYLLPRWHGQRGDVERFAEDVAESLPGDDGLEAYARIAAAIHQIDSERELLFFGAYDKSRLMKGAEVLSQRRKGNRVEANFAALCAWVAQDREAALRLRPLLEESVENEPIWPWQQHRREFDYWCRNEEFASTNEARWFWGSMFHGENLFFAADSQSVWCGGGYGPSAVNRLALHDGRILQALPAPAPRVDCFAVHEQQGWVVAGLTGSLFKGLMCWKLDNPNKPVTFNVDGHCRVVAINPIKPELAYATVNTVGLLNVQTGERGPTFEGPIDIRGLQFSADGKSLVVTTTYESIWDATTGTLRHTMKHLPMQPMPAVHCRKMLDIDREGRILAIVDKITPSPTRSLLVRYAADVKSWEPVIADLQKPFGLVSTAILSADHHLLAINRIRESKRLPRIEIEVWDVKSGQKLKHFDGHYSQFHAMSFSPDGKWLASMGFPTGLVKIWSLDESPSEGTNTDSH